ncbi:hypothetical protein MP638_005625 [Amoeboaphelidium occidentale]|nr:hypothetical protein MP638_005625 [Amoeboaphelidium occidentale]
MGPYGVSDIRIPNLLKDSERPLFEVQLAGISTSFFIEISALNNDFKNAVILGAAKFTGAYTGSYGSKDDDGLISKAYIYYSAIVRCVRVGISVTSIMADYKLSLRDSVTKGLSEEEAELIWSKCHKRLAEKLLDTFKKNEGDYIKFGQHISALVYLLPDEYTETMKVLQNMCPQSSLDAVKSVIEADLRKPFHEVFAEFDHDPVGSASLAQVHRARLKTGEDVAVKVQHFYVCHFAPFDIALTDFMVKVVNCTCNRQ